MNKERRKALQEVCDLIGQAKDLLEQVQEEEQEAFDNLPEVIQMSERGEQMEDNSSEMTDAYDNLDNVMDQIIGIIEG